MIREGGGALAKGLFRGVTGILTKPLEGAKSSGVEGFVQGVGKGLIGAATQPVSGVLDLLSKTTEGANAVRMRIASAIMSEEQLLRKRLPRAIGGDNLLRPYDEYKAQGQVINLHLIEYQFFFCKSVKSKLVHMNLLGVFLNCKAYAMQPHVTAMRSLSVPPTQHMWLIFITMVLKNHFNFFSSF